MTELPVKPDTHNRAEVWYLLEKQQVFSRSLLWGLQRHYFAERGVDAWRQGEVPHYVTSNPTVANSYAEIVFAFRRDQHSTAPDDEPLYLCELGAGSGRFAYHFLHRLNHLCEQAGLALESFCYVLTDLAAGNLDFWRRHPRFQPFFERGVLDIALFDIDHSEQLALKLSGKTITARSLSRPLVVMANYVLDSIPQELYYIDDGQCHQCLVSVFIDEAPERLGTAELLARLQVHYDYQLLAEGPYGEAYVQDLMAAYQRTLSDTHLLIPAAGLSCLRRLQGLSKQGMLLLSADKGDHRLSELQGKSPPNLVRHGSFSLPVNYHAFKAFCEQDGGIALFPDSRHNSVNVNCLLMPGETSGSYIETRRAFQRHVQEFSPDDFYSITKHARKYIDEMSVEDILAYVRLSHYDPHQFARYVPRLLVLAPELDHNACQAVSDAIEKVWELYFPLGEGLDLAYRIACLLYEMDDYPRALTYFERSIEIYGQHTGTLYNMAVCYHLLEQHNKVAPLLQKVLKYDPGNEQARALLESSGDKGTHEDLASA